MKNAKNLIIAGVVGLAFMAGGFWFGLRLKPLPAPVTKEAAAAALAENAGPAAPPPFSMDTLKKASESMMSLNEALQTREQKVTEREQAVKAKEDELSAERAALASSHEKFKALFEEFQQRLQLVEANQLDQLQKQAALYESMGSDQAIDLMRVMDDPSITRLFSVMDTKPLGKLVAQWKTKYPEDGQRLVAALNGMAEVLPKEKIALSDSPAASGAAAPASDASAPAPAADSNSPAPADTTGDSPTVPVPDATAQPSATPTAPPTSNPAPAPDSTPPADSTSPSNTNPPAPATPPPDSTPSPAPAAVSTTASN